MAERRALPTDQEVRAYMRKLKGFRESLSPREQHMLDAVVLSAYWADEEDVDTRAYELPKPAAIYDETAAAPPLDATGWGKVLGNV